MPLLAIAALLAAAAPGPGPGVRVEHGDVLIRDAGGTSRVLTHGGGFSGAALSPDGRQVALIHEDAPKGGGALDGPLTSLWVVDIAGGAPRRLLAPKPADDPKRELDSFGNPHWSLDGGYIYVDAAAWATSSALHRVEVATGQERFVIDGGLVGVIRNGPYRGYLLVQQHKYHPAPRYGSYDPVSLYRPDGRFVLRIPGSAADEGEKSVPAWLKAKHWTAD